MPILARSWPLLLLLPAAAMPAATAMCEAQSGAKPRTVVELYTSEGCSSCPPADRWLSTLKGRDDVVALSFHVNYWDKLGWPDPFASAEATERQRLVQRASGAAYVYTPQVVVDGQDWRGWPGRLPAAPAAQPPALQLQRDGDRVTARIAAAPGERRQLAGYWAVLEDGHRSRVRAGENAGSTLAHDHIVRRYQPVAAWPSQEARRFEFTLPAAATGTQPRRVVFVVTDSALARPLQSVVLAC